MAQYKAVVKATKSGPLGVRGDPVKILGSFSANSLEEARDVVRHRMTARPAMLVKWIEDGKMVVEVK